MKINPCLLMVCFAAVSVSSSFNLSDSVLIKGFLVFDNPDYCFLLELKDTANAGNPNCFARLIGGTKKTAIVIPGNWVAKMQKIIKHIDTVRRSDIPPGFVEDIYEIHYVPVSIKLSSSFRTEKKTNYYFRFKGGSLRFHTQKLAWAVFDIAPDDFCH